VTAIGDCSPKKIDFFHAALAEPMAMCFAVVMLAEERDDETFLKCRGAPANRTPSAKTKPAATIARLTVSLGRQDVRVTAQGDSPFGVGFCGGHLFSEYHGDSVRGVAREGRGE
jgi:hypothetical protein